MADNTLFDEIISWWLVEDENKSTKEADVLESALRELGVMFSEEHLASTQVVTDWFQDGEETYLTIGEVQINGKERDRTILIAAHAIITPPTNISLEERATDWNIRANKLREYNVNVPRWYLIYKATIYSYYPPHALNEYLADETIPTDDHEDLAKSLRLTLRGMAELGIQPLGLLSSLRTDSFNIYYCGMGFDVGEVDPTRKANSLELYEKQILPHLPQLFVDVYNTVED